MFNKIIYGDRLRKSRLHDEKGNIIDAWNFVTHAPMAFSTGVLRLLFDYRPVMPWISYNAIADISRHLSSNSTVLEFGSGMSTIWYAKLAGQVFSVEDYDPWYRKVKFLLDKKEINNVCYAFAEGRDYYTFTKNQDVKFDLIMVDGSFRSDCIKQSAKKLKSNGIIYLDNSDKHSSPTGGDTRTAENFLLEFAKSKNAKVQYYTDFAPTQFFVQQGMLVKLESSN